MSACLPLAAAANLIVPAMLALGFAMMAVAVAMLRRRRFASITLTVHPEQDREIIRSALPGGFVEPVLYVRPPLFVRLALTARAALAPRKGSRR